MNNYWHFVVIGVVMATMTIHFKTILFIVIYATWLIILFVMKRLNIVQLIIYLSSLIFFYMYIPNIADYESLAHLKMDTFTGKITSEVTRSEERISFIFDDIKLEKRLQVNYFKEKGDDEIDSINMAKHGAECFIKGQIRTDLEPTNPGQFNYQNYLHTKGIDGEIIIQSKSDLQCKGSSPLHYLHQFRAYLLAKVNESLNPIAASWLQALIIGDDSGLDDEMIELFQRWGLSHLLAISGLHVGLIVAIIYFLLSKTNLVTKETAKISLIILLPLYIIVAGSMPSVWRAGLMTVIVLFLSKFQTRIQTSDVFSYVFLMLVLLNPFYVYEVGFQMSFIVTFGLLLSRKWISNSPNITTQMLRISFISQMMISPLQIIYFHHIQPLSILINLLVVPYFSFIVIPFMLILLIMIWLPKFILNVLAVPFAMMHKLFIQLLKWFDQIFDTPLLIGEMSIYFIVLYFVLVVICLVYLQKEKLKQGFIVSVVIVFVMLKEAVIPYISDEGTVTMIDMGQGDTFIIELPYRQAVIFIDAGARFSFENMKPTDSVYKQVIAPYLNSRGIQEIDAIFISHEDLDHDGSVPYLLNDLIVHEVIVSHFYEPSEVTFEAFKQNQTRVTMLQAGEVKKIKGLSFHALGPLTQTDSANENSLVLYTNLGGKGFLFTGDIGKATEKELMKAYPNLRLDVLKVGHHGSKNSTDEAFIEHYQPAFALISAGRENRYGHPAAEVLNILNNAEAVIYRTDLQGAVQYKFRGQTGTFEAFLE